MRDAAALCKSPGKSRQSTVQCMVTLPDVVVERLAVRQLECRSRYFSELTFIHTIRLMLHRTCFILAAVY